MPEWLKQTFYQHTTDASRFLLVISPETNADCGVGYAYSLPTTPPADAQGKSVGAEVARLRDQSQEQWRPLHTAPLDSAVMGIPATSSEPKNLDLYLHSLYLFGSEKGYSDFFRTLERVGNEFDGEHPLNHVDYLSLLDCQSDAEQTFRRLVVTPIFMQSTIVGHLQWTWKYCREEQYELAMEHVKAAQECHEIVSHSSAGSVSDAVISSPLFTAETLKHLAEMISMLQSVIQLRQSKPGANHSEHLAELTFAQVPSLRYPYAFFVYEVAAKLEREARAMLASLPDRSMEAIVVRFQNAIDQYQACLRHLQQHFHASSIYHADYLQAACHLALGRVQNSVERTQVGFRLFPKEASERVKIHVDTARELLGRMQGKYPDRRSWTRFLDACCQFELGDVEAIEAWEASWQKTEEPEPSEEAHRDTMRAAAAIYNSSLAEQLRGNYGAAIKDIGTLASLNKQGYQNSFYEQLLFVINRSLTPDSAGASITAASSITSEQLTPLMEHISHRKTREEPSARLRDVLCKPLKGEDIDQILVLLSLGNPCHLRHFAGATLDLLLIRRLLQKLEAYLLTGKLLYKDTHGDIRGPLAIQETHSFPSQIWNELTSRTKWGFYELLTASALKKSVSSLALKQSVIDDKYTHYYVSLLWEYERHIITPLRIVHRYCTDEKKEQWPYISASSSKTKSIDVAQVLRNDTPHIIKDLRMKYDKVKRKYQLEVYELSNLYTSEVEYTILEALLTNDATGYARPVFVALDTLKQHCSELVSALHGPIYCDSQIWPDPKNRTQGSADRRIVKEQAARSAAVHLIKDLRNYYSHARGTNVVFPRIDGG